MNLYQLMHDLAVDVSPAQRRLIAILDPSGGHCLAGYAKMEQTVRLDRFIRLEYPAMIANTAGNIVVESFPTAEGSFLVDISQWGVGLGFLSTGYVAYYQAWLRQTHPELFKDLPAPTPPPREPEFAD